MSRVLPILFNTEMVRAILDGRKTVTRRVVKFPVNRYTNKMPDADSVSVYPRTLHDEKISFHEEPFYCFNVKTPYQLEDILYVRESFCQNYFDEGLAGYRGDGLRGNRNAYKADYRKDIVGDVVPEPKWTPSIHMPKEAARIWLKVTDVRVERLRDITEEQAYREGVIKAHDDSFNRDYWYYKEGQNYLTGNVWAESARQCFLWGIWNGTLKKTDYDRYCNNANPWVWVIEFERCGKPE